MKKFLCYDTNDAASGKNNVSANGVLSTNATVPSTNGTAYQQLVTDGNGNTKMIMSWKVLWRKKEMDTNS